MLAKNITLETRIGILSRVLEKPEQSEKSKQQKLVEQELRGANGDLPAATSKLKGKVSAKTLQKLHVADLVVDAVGDNQEVVKTLLGHPHIKTPRDVAMLNVDALTKMIAPDAQPDTDVYDEAKSQAIAINNQSFSREPLTVLQRMTREREIPLINESVRVGISAVLERIPADTDIRITPIHKILTEDALKDIPLEERPAVVDQAKALWRTLAVTPPDAPHVPPILMKTNLTSAFHIGEKPESVFMKMCGKEMGEDVARQVYTHAINTRIRNEHALITLRETIYGTGLNAIDGTQTREERLAIAKSQLEEKDTQLNLDSLFGDMDYCENKDCQSIYSASSYFVELLNFLRNNNLGPDPATGEANPNIHTGIQNTPLEKLFRRRPDLGDLELTCENTNTVIPYIDLVNEVMESFVVNRGKYHADKNDPKQTTIEGFNVVDETKDELLAQPQHTNFDAYCVLKNEAVYPFTLPFHQPIEVARIFLKYLGTSRYEILDTFRAAHESSDNLRALHFRLRDACNPDPLREPNSDPEFTESEREELKVLHTETVNRSADAEFLGLTQDEYIILTKEAFWPKHYFEVTQKKEYLEEEYQRNIGVRGTWDYYGFDSNDKNSNPQIELSKVKDEFLPRTGIQYTDLVELLKTRFINPNYPKGIALTILENIHSSYRFLQTLVTSSTDEEIRFANLIDFLESDETLLSKISEALTSDHVVKSGRSAEKTALRRWVKDWFEKLGQLIVLESSKTQHITGSIYAHLKCMIGQSLPVIVGSFEFENIGSIIDPAGVQCASITATGKLIWLDGNPILEKFHPDSYGFYLQDNFGNKWKINAENVIENWMSLHLSQPSTDTCNIENVRLLHLNGSLLECNEYDSIQRFIRLWRKLSWTIDELDKALEGLATNSAITNEPGRRPSFEDFTAFKDSCLCTSDDTRPSLDDVLVRTITCDITPAFLHQLVAVKKLLDRTGLPLIKLLSFWADISTTGEKSLYSRLFLTHNMLGIDRVFKADDNGNYLTGNAKIVDHLPVLMAALKLKADDIAAILNLKPRLETTPTNPLDDALKLPNVSEIYRYGLLAKTLHIKVSELADLKALFGEPFTNADITLKLFETWEKMEDAGFTFRQLTYTIQDCDDAQKRLGPSMKTLLQISKTLYDGLNAIDRDNPDIIDPQEATEELVRAKAGLLFESSVVDKILSFLNGTTIYTTNAPPKLNIEIPDSLSRKFSYHDQKGACPPKASIRVIGILTDDEKRDVPASLKDSDSLTRINNQAKNSFKDMLGDIILTDDPTRTNEDITNHRLHPLAGDVVVPAYEILPDQPDPNTAPKKRLYFLHYYLPILRQKLEYKFITDTLAAAVGLTSDVTNVLLLEALSADSSSTKAMIALQNIKEQRASGAGWHGYLIPPADDLYIFVATGDTEPLAIYIDTQRQSFVERQLDPSNLWLTDPLQLKAGILYELKICDIGTDPLQWRTTTSPIAPIPDSALLPDFTSETTDEIAIKLFKAAIVVNGFGLSADEVHYFQANGSNFGNFNFNAVTLQSWQRIADYVALRNTLPKAGEPLLSLFEWACQREQSATLIEKLNKVTQWKADRIEALIAEKHFDLNNPTAFQDERDLVRMQKAIDVADKVGVDIDRLFYWALPGSKFWLCHQIAQDIRMAMRARFDQEDWEQAVKPLNDQLREMQKQALISFLLVQPDLKDWPVVDADSLFEFFLIDVQMGAERQTSRMVQAIASVQLFIKRCLMGLEEKYGVESDAIDRGRWEWMQKYRVWEANRKVYLYPENWIRPELRDDKSPFYKELESELLQKDINSETVTEALKNYLYKVDEVSNLQVVGLYYDQQRLKLHIFARTRNAPYLFYYRYFNNKEDEKNWYPWEKMQVDIPSYDVERKDASGDTHTQNGTFLIPVVWNNRLMVFFPQFTKKTIPAVVPAKSLLDRGDSIEDESKPTELWEIKMAWSEYRSSKWTSKQISTGVVNEIYLKTTSNSKSYTIKTGPDISSFVFVPIITDNSVIIDIYCADKVEQRIDKPEPPPAPKFTLVKAELHIHTYDENKNADNNYFVKVHRPNESTDIAKLDAAGNGIEYPKESIRDLEMDIPLIDVTKESCVGFNVAIQQHPNGTDTWKFGAKVTLTFRDKVKGTESTLTATGNNIILIDNNPSTNCVTFESKDVL